MTRALVIAGCLVAAALVNEPDTSHRCALAKGSQATIVSS